MEKLVRPRCKGTCGDAECEEMENTWRQAHGMDSLIVDETPLFNAADLISE